jgi:hypothetical protein
MGFIRRRPFRGQRDGGLLVSLDPTEVALLQQLVAELSGLFAGQAGCSGQVGSAGQGEEPLHETDQRVLERLFPRAYLDPTEEQAEAEWQRLVHDDLLTGRRKALEVVRVKLDDTESRKGRLEVSITAAEAEAFLAVINDSRLALGTRLGVTEDLDLSGLDPDDPDTGPYAIYWWLGMLEEHLVEALLG